MSVSAEPPEQFVDMVARRVTDPRRLGAVAATGLLDTAAEAGFDRIASLASELLGTPCGFLTVVDDTRSFWKACIGVDATDLADRQNQVDESFCQYVIGQYVIGLDDAVMVGDARLDERTMNNPSIDSMGVVAWAGVPVRASTGEVLGTLCVVDTVVRAWTDADRSILTRLADITADEIRARQSETAARRSKALLGAIIEQSPLGFYLVDDQMCYDMINAAMADINGVSIADHIGRTVTEVVPDVGSSIVPLIRHVFDTGEQIADVEITGTRPSRPGIERTWLTSYFRVDTDGHPIGVAGLVSDVTDTVRVRRRADQLAVITRRLAAVDTTDELLDIVNDAGATYLDADTIAVGIIDPADDSLNIMTAQPPEALAGRIATTQDPTPYGHTIRTGDPVLITDRAQRLRDFPAGVEVTDVTGDSSSATVALFGAGYQIVGVLIVGWHDDRAEFPLPQLNVLADAIAQTLQRTRSSADRRAFTTSLQHTLLSPAPVIDELDIAVRYVPAGSTIGFGGDWYDIVRLDGHRCAVIVGDVAGHDATAAARMSHVRTIISALVQLGTPLALLYAEAERLLANHESTMYATVSVTVIDTAAHTLTTVVAGHPPPLLTQPDGTTDPVGHTRCAILGVSSPTVTPTPVDYQPGSTLVAYTDGLIETRNSDIHQDIERLRRFVVHTVGISANDVADKILAEFAPTPDLPDDAVVVVVAL